MKNPYKSSFHRNALERHLAALIRQVDQCLLGERKVNRRGRRSTNAEARSQMRQSKRRSHPKAKKRNGKRVFCQRNKTTCILLRHPYLLSKVKGSEPSHPANEEADCQNMLSELRSSNSVRKVWTRLFRLWTKREVADGLGDSQHMLGWEHRIRLFRHRLIEREDPPL